MTTQDIHNLIAQFPKQDDYITKIVISDKNFDKLKEGAESNTNFIEVCGIKVVGSPYMQEGSKPFPIKKSMEITTIPIELSPKDLMLKEDMDYYSKQIYSALKVPLPIMTDPLFWPIRNRNLTKYKMVRVIIRDKRFSRPVTYYYKSMI